MKIAIKKLAERIQQLEPIGRPLKPTPPKPVPDVLGAPAVKPETARE